MKKRDSNIELLRIVLIIMIILHHIVVRGFGLNQMWIDFETNDITVLGILINSFVIIGVNVFIFISGYYGIQFKMKTLISILLQAVFYSLIAYCIVLSLNMQPFKIMIFISYFFPISKTLWWYLTVYVCVYIISPILNAGIEKLSNKQLLFIVSFFLYFNCFGGFLMNSYISFSGFSFFSFISIYILGRSLSRIEFNMELKYSITCYILVALLIFSLVYFGIRANHFKLVGPLFAYNNILVIIGAVSFFYIFKNLKINNKFINSVSPLVLGVYLMHENIGSKEIILFVFNRIKMFSFNNDFVLLILTISYALVIFFVCCLIEKIRQLITDQIVEKIVKSKYFNIINSIWIK